MASIAQFTTTQSNDPEYSSIVSSGAELAATAIGRISQIERESSWPNAASFLIVSRIPIDRGSIISPSLRSGKRFRRRRSQKLFFIYLAPSLIEAKLLVSAIH
jgi:hypothetical protein